jgi:chemotaxis family two-component system response regulator Rcp1
MMTIAIETGTLRGPLMPRPWSPPMCGQSIVILLVEDSPDDAELMIKALGGGQLTSHVSRVEDGEDAMAFLRREGQFADAPRPDLILLDLGLVRMHGPEVLTEIKQDPDLRGIRVVVMTSFAGAQSVDGVQADFSVRKPGDIDEYALAVREIEEFWLHG